MIRGFLLYIILIAAFTSNAQTPLLLGTKAISTTVPSRFVSVMIYSSGGSLNAFDPGTAPTNWNKWAITTSDASSMNNLIYTDNGAASTIDVAINGCDNSIPDNGSSYCSSPTDGFPQIVHRTGVYSSGTVTITITGCDDGKTYNFKALGTRVTSDHNNLYTKTGGTPPNPADGIANIQNNCSDAANLTGLKSSSGSMTITVTLVSGGFIYLNGWIIEEVG